MHLLLVAMHLLLCSGFLRSKVFKDGPLEGRARHSARSRVLTGRNVGTQNESNVHFTIAMGLLMNCRAPVGACKGLQLHRIVLFCQGNLGTRAVIPKIVKGVRHQEDSQTHA